jgi:hypothetical protein
MSYNSSFKIFSESHPLINSKNTARRLSRGAVVRLARSERQIGQRSDKSKQTSIKSRRNKASVAGETITRTK